MRFIVLRETAPEVPYNENMAFERYEFMDTCYFEILSEESDVNNG